MNESYNIRPFDFPIIERRLIEGRASMNNQTGQIKLIQLPKTGPTPTPMPPSQAQSTSPIESLSGLLDKQVLGIPVKYLALGAAAWFLFMRK